MILYSPLQNKKIQNISLRKPNDSYNSICYINSGNIFSIENVIYFSKYTTTLLELNKCLPLFDS